MWTLILEGLPRTKFGRAKNDQNLARFLTTFDFGRKYLRKGSKQRKYQNCVINGNPSTIVRKKFGELFGGPATQCVVCVDPKAVA